MKARRALAAALAAALVVPVLLLLGPGHVATAAEDGSVTKSGTGRFSDLKVTVSQTEHLGNQVVRVTWTGGKQSSTIGRSFFNNYLQIMQCWGDEAAPRREKCQYGGIFDDQRGGQATSSRDVVNNGNLADPNETYSAPFPKTAMVPFESVDGKVSTGKRNPYFDTLSTNEIGYGRTATDGTGEEFFEIQTAREASGLGCGNPKADRKPRDCWLVVVPRDDIEVNGLDVDDLPGARLETSPLAASNFANAIAFRLKFDPVSVTCPLGAERQVLGNEEMTEATSRWQPVLCSAAGATFGYLQMGDDLARAQTMTDEPGLALVNRPLDPGMNVDNRLLTYAPVGISSIGIGLVIERYPRDSAPDAVKAKRGTRILDLKLNARLVAKLLTQSYKAAATSNDGGAYLGAKNARWLAEDPEFLALNPEFTDLQVIGELYAITNPLELTDANAAVWEWIASDPQAKAFIEGKPDSWGMKINKFYKGMSLERSDFPRSDPTCASFTNGQEKLCSLDHLAYSADFHAAARGAIRGLTLANDNWDFGPPPRYKQNPAQPAGERAVLALMDSATAARFQVSLARLKNASGRYVAPTEDSMDAAVAGMEEGDVPGVLKPDPGTKIRAAYPLTEVTYALTAPRKLSADDAKVYAGFVRYVAGKGQTQGIAPGQLPAGYLPLTEELRAQAKDAATLIAKRGGPLPASDPDGSGDGDSDGDGSGDGGTGEETPVAAPPIEGAAPGGAPVTTPGVGEVVPASSKTPAVDAGVTRFVLLAAALLGLLAALTRPALVIAGAVQRRRAAGSDSAPPESSR